MHTHEPISQIFDEARSRVLASLISTFRDFALAEDVLQDAFIAALEHWPAEGLLDQMGLDKALANYHLFHAARADLLRRLDLREEAAGEYRQALGLCQNEAEQHYLRKRLNEVVGGKY